VLEQTGGRRKNEIGRGRADHDQFDFARLDAGRFECRQRRAVGEIACSLAVGRDMTLADATARDNPLVAGVDQFFQIRVGDDPFRQKTAGSGNA